MTTEQKKRKLTELLKSMDRALVAFSGGIDSTYLLHAAAAALGRDRVLAVTAASPVMTREEQRQVKDLARALGVRLKTVPGPEMHDARFLKNGPMRCYWCKRARYRELQAIARREHLAVVIEGSNADDMADYRPGLQAVAELGVRTPLMEAGLAKKEIRRLARTAGLDNWNRPAAACLASRIAYGIPVSRALLTRIARGEALLHGAGFPEVRLRHHGDIARIEVPAAALPAMTKPAALKKITAGLKKLGWPYVTLDLEGYATGSLNRAVHKK